MLVRYGRTCEQGFLPVFTVDTKEEAEELLRRTCPRNVNGEFVAPELAGVQTLENLYAFGDRLAEEYAQMVKEQVTSAVLCQVK